MDKNELRIRVLLSLQVALLGEINSNIRGITCSWDSSRIDIRCIFHGEINEEDRESMEIVCTEVMADFPNHEVEIEYIRSDYPEILNKLAPQENPWVKPTWEYTKTINGSRFQATLKEREFELKFILTYWGLIGFDFGFINLSNVFIDRLRVPKYFFIAPIRKPTLPTNSFIEPISSV